MSRLFASLASACCGIALVGACATDGAADSAATQQQQQILELKHSQQNLEKKVADLDMRMALLLQRLEQDQVRVPTDLDVVRLVPPRQAAIDTAEIDEYDPDSEEVVNITLHGDAGKTKTPVASKGDVKATYAKARQLFVEGRFDAASRIFFDLQEQYPRHDLGDNSLYWYGICLFELGEHARAIETLHQLPLRYPRSDKVPDALLGIAQAYAALGDSVSAKAFWTQVVEQFPKSEAAAKARNALNAPETGN